MKNLFNYLGKIVRNLPQDTEGTRESMRSSYRKHYSIILKREGSSNTQSAHLAGLYGALSTRFTLRNIKFKEDEIWGELFPFLYMEEQTAVEAIAEYIVLKERPYDANIFFLKNEINNALRNVSKVEGFKISAYILPALNKWAQWLDLLEQDVKNMIVAEVEK